MRTKLRTNNEEYIIAHIPAGAGLVGMAMCVRQTCAMQLLKLNIVATDNTSDWISFFNVDNIIVNINLENLGETNDGADSPQKDFTQNMAHELLHDWWTLFEPYLKLKWHVIEDKAKTDNPKRYILANSLDKTDAKNYNQSCSEGDGHERHNPETQKVCTDQYEY